MMTSERKRVRSSGDRIAAFAHEYRDMQNLISRLGDDPLPPCYYCQPVQIWNCSRTSRQCKRFREYCSGRKGPLN